MPYYPPASSGSFLPLAGGTMTGQITSTLGTITSDVRVHSATATWNSAGVTFYGFYQDITNTASAAASRLFDFRVGGSSLVNLATDGQILIGTSTAFTSQTFVPRLVMSNNYPAITFKQTASGANTGTIGINDGILEFMADNSGAAYGRRFKMSLEEGKMLINYDTTNAVNPSFTTHAALEIKSTLGALLLPRMNSTQRDAMTPTAGMLIYNTSTGKLNVYTTAWEAVTSA